MLGTVQIGVIAAAFVLFVPMGMAGWHLSRNKMLFFSGLLFITLAVVVHLTPYFPSISDLTRSFSSAGVEQTRDSCFPLLHEVVYDLDQVTVMESLNYTKSLKYKRSWHWVRSAPVVSCGFKKLAQSDASELLNGSWVVVGGDSQSRLMVLALLNLLIRPNRMELVQEDLFKRHSNYHIQIDEIGMRLDFVWAPYIANMTDFLMECHKTKVYPDVLIMGSGLWHMLHVTNASDYGMSLEHFENLIVSSHEWSGFGSLSISLPYLFWINMPSLINELLNTEEKKTKMTDAMLDAYNREVYKSGILIESGGPFMLLNIHSLSRKCGIQCTSDGVHYDIDVYEVAVQIMLNALVIKSHQVF